jgi:hypothetical protein
MKAQVFISVCWFVSSLQHAEKPNIIENQWVWRNGELVHIPKMNTSSIKDSKTSGNLQKVQWKLSQGELKSSQQHINEPLKPKEKFDPYLADIPVASSGYIKTPQFKPHPSLDDHSLPLEFSDGELPPKLNHTQNKKSKIKISSIFTKASEQNLSAKEIKAWGISLSKTGVDLNKLEQKLKDSNDPFQFKEYLIKSEKQKRDLALYREQVSRIRN